MTRAAALLAIAALLCAPALALAQGAEFTADLSADAEVPAPTVPGDYAGTGSATVTLSDDESEINYEVTFEGLTGPLVMAHIHWGAPGEAGPPIFWLTEEGVSGAESPLSGTLTEADFMAADGGPQSFAEALEAMRAGNTYVNLHTEANMPGEIRGQLTASGPTGSPGAESPAAESPAGESPAATPPDTSMADQAPGTGTAWLAMFAILALAVLTFLAAARVRAGRAA